MNVTNKKWAVSVKDGISPCEKVKIESFSISKEAADKANIFTSRFTKLYPGDYKRLMVNNDVMMSNTEFEIQTNMEFVSLASGNILINGLGLAMILEKLLLKEDVNHVTVIEKDKRIIDLVGHQFENNNRVSIIHEDAFKFKPKRGTYYDYVWHDIWQFISGDNLAEMSKLHKKYYHRSGWQGSWAKDLCKLSSKGFKI
jgi:hypothetical protein